MATVYTKALNQYTGNGVSNQFNITFPYKNKSDVKVYLKQGLDIQVVLQQDVDYTFVDDETILFPKEGSQYSVLTADDVLAFQRESEFSSEYEFSNQKRLFPEEVMNADDNLMRLVQENKRDLEKAIKIQPTSNIDSDTFFNEVDRIYQSADAVDAVANEIEAILDAPNQATAAAQSAIEAEQSATEAAASASAADASAAASAASASAADASAAASAASASAADTSAAASAASASAADASAAAAAASASAADASAAASAGSAQTAQDYAVQAARCNIGDIFYTSRLDTELNGAVEANGGVYAVAGFTGERSVPALLAEGKLPYVSMSEYESIVSANGSCRAFGWDGADATVFKVPKLNDVYIQAGTAASAGEFISESLPNISGYINNTSPSGQDYFEGGALYWQNKNYSYPSALNNVTDKNYGATILFDASRSSPTYQDGAKVRPDSVRYRAMVQLATGVKEDASKLKEYQFNNPNFFGQSMWTDVEPNNASWLVSNGQWNARAVYPDYYDWLVGQMNAGVSGFVASTATYTDYDFVINTADQTFRLPLLNGEEDLPSDNVENITFLATGSIYPVTKNGYFVLDIPVTGVGGQIWAGTYSWFDGRSSGEGYIQWTSPLCKRGQNMELRYFNVGTPARFTFTASVGNGSLYFYVGDTVQDASLINAGAVLSDIADLRGNKANTNLSNLNAAGQAKFDAKANAAQFQVVSALPAQPDPNVFYFIPE